MSTPIYKEASAACANCGEPATGAFCPACGEEQPGHHDLSLRHFFHEAIHEFIHFDSRLFRTLNALFFQPGFLTVEYFAGRKARYFRPLRLYLVIFALSLFVFSLYRPISLYDFGRVVQQEQTGKIGQLMAKRATKMHTTPDELADRVTAKWQRNLSFLQLMYVLMLAGVLKLIFLNTGKYYVEHLVFALHYYSFNFLWGVLMWPLYYLSGGLDPFGKTLWVTVLSYTVHIIYMFLALRRVYAQSTGAAAFRTFVLVAAGLVMLGIAIVTALLIALVQVMR